MNNSHFRLGAIDCVTKNYTSPYDAKKNNHYQCLECNEKVIFKKGNIKCPHFAHYVYSNCSYYDHPNESQIHKDAKRRIISWLKNKIQLGFYKKCMTCKDGLLYEIIYQDGNQYLQEYRDIFGKYIADVAILDKANNPRYIIEVKNTHKTKSVRPEPWYEIEAKEILEYENLDKIILNDIRDFECQTCKDLIPIFDNFAKELGYFIKSEYYSYPVQKIMDEAIKGKYFYYDDHWTSYPSSVSRNFWIQFLTHKRCIRCRTPSHVKKNRPYCVNCYKFIKAEENMGCDDPEYFLKSKDSNRKNELRKRLSFLDKVPGEWTIGDSCYFCDKKSDSCHLYENHSYTWWFGDKKKICIRCLDEACKIKNIEYDEPIYIQIENK